MFDYSLTKHNTNKLENYYVHNLYETSRNSFTKLVTCVSKNKYFQNILQLNKKKERKYRQFIGDIKISNLMPNIVEVIFNLETKDLNIEHYHIMCITVYKLNLGIFET